MIEDEPQSPCVSICHLDEKGICQGCYRSAGEIADWLMLGAEGKCQILARALARREEADAGKPAS